MVKKSIHCNDLKMLVEKVCRLCLVDANQGMKSIFSNFEEGNSDETIADTVFMLFGIKIDENDVYSHLVCDRCYQKITTFMYYRKKFQKNQVVLRKRHYEHTKSKDQISSKDADDVIFLEPDVTKKFNDALSVHNPVTDTIVLDEEISLLKKTQDDISSTDQKEILVATYGKTNPEYIRVPLEYLNAVCPFVELDSFTDATRTYKQISTETYKENNVTSSPALDAPKSEETQIPNTVVTENENVFCTIKSVSVLVCEYCSRTFKSQPLLEFHCRKLHNLQDGVEIIDKRKKVHKLKKITHIAKKSTQINRPHNVPHKFQSSHKDVPTQNKFNKKASLLGKIKKKLHKIKKNRSNSDSIVTSGTDTDAVDPLQISEGSDNSGVTKKRRGRPCKVKKLRPAANEVSSENNWKNVYLKENGCDQSVQNGSDSVQKLKALSDTVISDKGILSGSSHAGPEKNTTFSGLNEDIDKETNNSFDNTNSSLNSSNNSIRKKRGRPKKMRSTSHISKTNKPVTGEKYPTKKEFSNETKVSEVTPASVIPETEVILSDSSDAESEKSYVFSPLDVPNNTAKDDINNISKNLAIINDRLNSVNNYMLKKPSRNQFSTKTSVSKVTPNSGMSENEVIVSDSSDAEFENSNAFSDLNVSKNVVKKDNNLGNSVGNKNDSLNSFKLLSTNNVTKTNDALTNPKDLFNSAITVTKVTSNSVPLESAVILSDSSDAECEKSNVSKNLGKQDRNNIGSNNKSGIFNNLSNSISDKGRTKKLLTTANILNTSKPIMSGTQEHLTKKPNSENICIITESGIISSNSSDAGSDKNFHFSSSDPLDVSEDLGKDTKDISNSFDSKNASLNSLSTAKTKKRGRPRKTTPLTSDKPLTGKKRGRPRKIVSSTETSESGETQSSVISEKVQFSSKSASITTYSQTKCDNLTKEKTRTDFTASSQIVTAPVELVDVDQISVDTPRKNMLELDPLGTVFSEYTNEFGSACRINSMIESQTHQINQLKSIVEECLQGSNQSSSLVKNEVIDLT